MTAPTIADTLAKGQKDISVAEFFERNRQILGFDSPTKALITSVKEAVDNALDACEEANILPDIQVGLSPTEHKDEFRLWVEDNGPGIVRKAMPKVFARLLHGSRFHAIRQSRGQQGIGISAVVLYGQITTGHHAVIHSKVGQGHPAIRMELSIDTKTNNPVEHDVATEHWEKDHGTRVEVVLKGRYQTGKQSVHEYLRSTAIVNPHARITFTDPSGQRHLFERTAEELPRKAVEVKPHPHGTELGTLLKMAHASEQRKLQSFLVTEFSSVGTDTAKKILTEAKLANGAPQDLTRDDARRLLEAFQQVKIMAPSTDCLSPVGEQLIRRGLKQETADVSPEFITTVTRSAAVYSGHPFQVEVGIVFGGTLPREEPVRVLRFANRVPLLYQPGACGATIAVQDVDWRRYGLDQRGGKGLPVGPAIMLVHVASTKVPFTSEAKEAVAEIEEIHKEIKLGLQEAARLLGRHLRKKEKRAKVSEKFTLVTKILPEINRKAAAMLKKPEPDLATIVCKIMDVIWIDDAVAEYEKLEGQTVDAPTRVAPSPEPEGAPAAKGKKAKAGKGKLEDFDDPSAAAPVASGQPGEPPQKRQAYLATARIGITNFKLKPQRFRLFVVLPEKAVFVSAEPKAKVVTERYVAWDVSGLKPTQKTELKLQVGGVGKGDLDGIDTYVEGINEIHVVGADPWHGGEE